MAPRLISKDRRVFHEPIQKSMVRHAGCGTAAVCRFRNLEMKYRDIRDFSRKRMLGFPVFTISMNDGESYRFLIFSPKRFNALLSDKVSKRCP